MYSIKTAYALSQEMDAGYVEVQITNMPLIDLFRQYRSIYLHLEHTSNPGETYGYCMSHQRYHLQHRSDTVSQWLESLGTGSLQTDVPARQLQNNYVRYQDAHQLGYQIKLHASMEQVAEQNWDGDDSLVIIKHGMSYSGFLSRALVTLNGMIHYAKYTDFGIMVDYAKKTLLTGNNDTVGILDFSKVCQFSVEKITPDMVSRDGSNNVLGRRIQLNVGEGRINKAFGLVLMGKLFIGRPIITKTSETTININLEHVPLLRLFQTALKRIDLSSLPLDSHRTNPASVNVDELLSDEVILAMLALPQSFLITFDCEAIYQDYGMVHHTNLSKRYFSPEWVYEPLVDELGVIMEYHQIHEHGYNALMVLNDKTPLYNFDTTGSHNTVISDVVQPGMLDKKTVARRWKIFTSHMV